MPTASSVILDDAGQYEPAAGDRWRLVSVGERFATLGEKRNAAARYVSADAEALAVWDDDDLYLPWALAASVAALEQAAWSRPSVVLHPQPGGTLRQHRTGGLYHGGWAYRREAFDRVGGYPAMNNGEDQALAARLVRAQTPEADPIGLGFRPFYIYVWGSGRHLSSMGPRGYETLGTLAVERTTIRPADPPGIDLLRPRILPDVQPRTF